jgi:hypothetical protein
MQLFVGLQKYLTLANHIVMFLQLAIALTRVSLGYLQRYPLLSVCYVIHLESSNLLR